MENKKEIVVTPEMIQAGLDELHEHYIGQNWAEVLENVFRAMAYKMNEQKSGRHRDD